MNDVFVMNKNYTMIIYYILCYWLKLVVVVHNRNFDEDRHITMCVQMYT